VADADHIEVRRLREAYRAAFRRHWRNPSEATLLAAYELGRDAISNELSVLDLAAVHHDTLVSVLGEEASRDTLTITRAAAEFFQEALSAAEMIRRGFREARDAEVEAKRHATVVRRLSTLLSDSSIAAAGDETIAEVLQLVAEHARESMNAERVEARLDLPSQRFSLTTSEPAPDERTHENHLLVPLLALDGSRLGELEIWRSDFEFSSNETATVAHLVEMASAAIDRALLYRR
jgi:GAF domain-containing protein